MRSLCLFGGSFDPVHMGHLLVARAAFEELAVDRVVFIPAALSPFKADQPPSPAAVRLQMLRTALAGRSWVDVDDQEIRRGGVSYTIDTLRAFKKRYPDTLLYYLIGEDNVRELGDWREPRELARMAEFAVIPRPRAFPGDVLSEKAAEQASAELDRVGDAGFKLRCLKGFPLGVSSSEIRARVRSGLPVEDLLPFGVGEIIRNNRLYL